MRSILDSISSPADIRKLNLTQLRSLCEEIREYMIECCAVNPGHLGSSLGAVELIVGMHYVYNTPKDKIVFDVSHQSYAHKIITGRREAFRHIRTSGGISGFTRISESEYDSFGAGHSSTSISAALGLAKAESMQGLDGKVIAFIGDGSLSGGLAFEGLNNAGDCTTDLLVIVNDNNMSIDNNIGAVHHHLLELTTSPFYNTMKRRIWHLLGDGALRKKLQRMVITFKSHLVQRSGGDLFEALGFRYFGPIDGNDIEAVINALNRIKDLHGPRILHTITKKGKGYAPAEEDQTTWHAPGTFDPFTGKRIGHQNPGCRYQDVFGEVLLQLAKKDGRVVGITPAMASGSGMNLLAGEMPERFFDVGIAEEHAVTFSAGLAAGGMIPFCNIYSSFAQRAYDQIIHDVAIQNLHVILCLDRAGLVGEDGATHNGAFDLCAFRSIPNCTVAAPRNELELQNLMYTAYLEDNGPFIIRYPRGWAEGVRWRDVPFAELPVGKGEKLLDGDGILVLALGPFVNRALEAAGESEIHPSIWDVRYLKPFDQAIVAEMKSGRYHSILTIEDGAAKGGLFSEVCEIMRGRSVSISSIGLDDKFVEHGSQSQQRGLFSLDKEGIKKKLQEMSKSFAD